jgi:putative aldouronate transport system permease protein
MGFGAIVYIAALAGINPELHEAAIIDGASKLQCTLLSTFVHHADDHHHVHPVHGRDTVVGYEKAFLMQNTMNTSVSEIISTYVYKVGILNAQYPSHSRGTVQFPHQLCVLILTNFIVAGYGNLMFKEARHAKSASASRRRVAPLRGDLVFDIINTLLMRSSP